MKTSNSNIGILLIHGFAGSPSDVYPIKSFFEDKNFIVSSPTLKGHNSSKKVLSKTTYKDWIDSVILEGKELEKKCDTIYVIGFSMGGLIALNLKNHINFKKIVFLNSPVYYWNILQIIKNLLSNFKFYSNKYFFVSTNKSFNSLVEFLKIRKASLGLFSELQVPALILQTLDDDTVHYKSSQYIYNKIQCEKKIILYNNGGHCVFSSSNREDICNDIYRFFIA